MKTRSQKKPATKTKTTNLVPLPPAREALLVAAGILEDGPGWCQHASSDHEGRSCAVGSLYLASLLVDETTDCYFAACRLLEEIVGPTDGQHDIPSWNDREGRTQGEVVRAMKRAAVQG